MESYLGCGLPQSANTTAEITKVKYLALIFVLRMWRVWLFCGRLHYTDGLMTIIVMIMIIVDSITSESTSITTTWVWTVPSSRCKYVIWVISWPLIAVMFVTVPDCRQRRWRQWFVLTFLTSIAWIGVYSYLMVWMITVVGQSEGNFSIFPGTYSALF